MFVVKGKVQGSGFLEGAAEGEDGFGGGGVGGWGDGEVLSSQTNIVLVGSRASLAGNWTTKCCCCDWRATFYSTGKKGFPTYLIMPQPYPSLQLLRHSQNIPQRIDLKSVECLVHRSFQQRLQPMHPLLDFLPRFWILDIAIAVCISDGGVGSCCFGETESGGRGGEETGFDGFDGAVDDCVDGVDDVVDEGLGGGISGVLGGESEWRQTRGV